MIVDVMLNTMTEGEFAELLRYLQSRVVESGLAELNARISADLRVEAERPSVQFLRYMSALRSEIALGARESASAIVRRLREVSRTNSGGAIDGVAILVSEADRLALGVSQDII